MDTYECGSCDAMVRIEVLWDGGVGVGHCPMCGGATLELAGE